MYWVQKVRGTLLQVLMYALDLMQKMAGIVVDEASTSTTQVTVVDVCSMMALLWITQILAQHR